ncbi:MAG: aldose 1-epimerase family protein [Flavobacterium sp.]|nr:aldose 1-epimerase family protein [Flavobacterium sp.]
METTIYNSQLTAHINPVGAELVSLANNKNKQEYIWDGNPAFWGKHAPVLFPIVGTLKDNSYYCNDGKYSLSRHGFARDLKFELLNQSSNQVIYSLKYTYDTLKKYPFKFELQITYTLVEFTLYVGFQIFNLDTQTIPFSIGAHPAFALSDNFENYSLQFETQETLKCFSLKNDLLTSKTNNIDLINKKLPLTYSIFQNDALIMKSLKSEFITIIECEKPILKVTFKDFHNLGIWTKKNAAFICIEPWLGYSDLENTTGTIFEKEGIQILAENKSFECEYSIEIL